MILARKMRDHGERRRRAFFAIVLVGAVAAEARASAAVAVESRVVATAPPPLSEYVIVVAADATPIELHAAAIFSNHTLLPIEPAPGPASSPRIALGAGAASALAPTLPLDGLGDEGFCIDAMVAPAPLLVASGAPDGARGSLYAAYAMLETLGWGFYHPEEIDSPDPASVVPGNVSRRCETPALEYRETNAAMLLDESSAEWAAGAMRFNGEAFSARKPGGGTTFASPPGSVHTSFALVDPALNATYPEWFSEHVTQLCWANESLVAYVTERVREFLAASPNATLISVSQNDNGDYCTRPADAAVIAAEGGTPSAPLLRAVNAIAEAIEGDYPDVAVHTLAYQYTRAAPNATVPRANVIVQLCSIECSWAVPFDHPDNAAFAADMVAWNALSQRLFIWDYVVDFRAYAMPWPNYETLVPNARFLASHGELS